MNKDTNTPSDHDARQHAIDPARSFIVQAPAGSGKTELLTQRFLRLLAEAVNAPEEIIAITFTRKAAAEMRHRIIHALMTAKNEPKPVEPFRLLTWTLARNVLAQDKKQQWTLLENPNRLRIFTIDALCGHLCRQMPVLSQFGAQPNIVENPTDVYRQAAENLIRQIDNDAPHNTALDTLLTHCDNRVYQLESLFTDILSKREQWLPHIMMHRHSSDALKRAVETGLQNIVLEKMTALAHALTREQADELCHLARNAGQMLSRDNPEHPAAACAELGELPGTALEDLDYWVGMAHLLLTTQYEWRKTVTIRQGFAAKSDSKNQMLAFLAQLQDDDTLQQCFTDILQCPPIAYEDMQWAVMDALFAVLPILVAELHVIFQTQSVIDFVELNLAAHRALGEPDAPTDLALALDYQLKHLLVDEFQDTSISQFTLLEKLVAQWQPGDGRSLFLVGDPMQSIYRFRNAEVGLFLRAKTQGLADLSLEFLSLTRNFRSQAQLVDWMNQAFSTIFPTQADMTKGAVPLAEALAQQPADPKHTVHCHPAWDDLQTAAHTAQLIQHLQTAHPDDSIAVLVRSRTHLHNILPALHAAHIAFQAVDIEPLAPQPEIQDLFSLTRALHHRADRIAWLAILRAPWCGLTLADLHRIAQHAPNTTLWETLCDHTLIPTLSTHAQDALARVIPVLAHAFHQQGRMPVEHWIKGTWIALGGPATLSTPKQLSNVNSYCTLLRELSESAPFDLNTLRRKLITLFAEPNTQGNPNCHIMTIHKSKGLEFDHVIIPGLHRRASHDKTQLLSWLERPNQFGSSDLVLAPIKAAENDADPIVRYLQFIEKEKSTLEMARLLYVAATRAKKSLHFMAEISLNEKKPEQLKTPTTGSFLSMLWDHFSAELTERLHQDQLPEILDNIEETENEHALTRLTHTWQLPILSNGFSLQPPNNVTELHADEGHTTAIVLPDHTAKQLGTVIHAALEQLSYHHTPDNEHMDTLCHGEFKAELTTALQNTLNDERGQWILQPHPHAKSEYAITTLINNTPMHLVIDRTFVDEKKVRWIIDYKTSTPDETQSLDAFLAQEKQQYQEKMEQYAVAMQQLDSREIRLGLYFPLIPAWVEWTHQQNHYYSEANHRHPECSEGSPLSGTEPAHGDSSLHSE